MHVQTQGAPSCALSVLGAEKNSCASDDSSTMWPLISQASSIGNCLNKRSDDSVPGHSLLCYPITTCKTSWTISGRLRISIQQRTSGLVIEHGNCHALLLAASGDGWGLSSPTVHDAAVLLHLAPTSSSQALLLPEGAGFRFQNRHVWE